MVSEVIYFLLKTGQKNYKFSGLSANFIRREFSLIQINKKIVFKPNEIQFFLGAGDRRIQPA